MAVVRLARAPELWRQRAAPMSLLWLRLAAAGIRLTAASFLPVARLCRQAAGTTQVAEILRQARVARRGRQHGAS